MYFISIAALSSDFFYIGFRCCYLTRFLYVNNHHDSCLWLMQESDACLLALSLWSSTYNWFVFAIYWWYRKMNLEIKFIQEVRKTNWVHHEMKRSVEPSTNMFGSGQHIIWEPVSVHCLFWTSNADGPSEQQVCPEQWQWNGFTWTCKPLDQTQKIIF
jgi:hypothetical protein